MDDLDENGFPLGFQTGEGMGNSPFDDDDFEIDHIPLEKLTLLDALDTIEMASYKSKLSDDLWDECKDEFEFLRKRTGLNNKQLVVLACLCEAGDGMSWRALGRQLGLTRLKTMSLSPDIEDMREKRWVIPYGCQEGPTCFEGFKQVPGIITAFRENRNFEPEVLAGLSEQAFVDRLAQYMMNEANNRNVPNTAHHWWLLFLLRSNPDLPVCQAVNKLTDDMSKIIFLAALGDYAYFGGESNEGLRMHDIEVLFKPGRELSDCLRAFQDDSHELMAHDLLEHACVDGMADMELFRLTRNVKDKLLPEFVQTSKPKRRRATPSTRDLLKASSVKPKQLYFDEEVQTQVDRVNTLLDTGNLTKVQERLEHLGHRKGICCLFYGAPGTGKTESVLQLARQSGRDILQVNIASIRNKFVGETEKNIKEIFSRYNALCRKITPMPILLFNEADALINSRLETVHSSVEKMDNALQNIILQEMETLEGILIATTNLTGTLDRAFDRRFLFKVEFAKPSVKTKAAIWCDKLPNLNKKEALQLAKEFDFSGGQIENIGRKCEIDYALTGAEASFPAIMKYCREETLRRNNHSRIGF